MLVNQKQKMHVSIAMATYNGEKYLLQQLYSIIAQTHLPDEIIIVDDCSTDNTREILKQYSYKYDFIKLYFNETNSGVVKTFEHAIGLCSGDFIALADQDDVWFPTKIEELVNNIGDSWLIHSDAMLVDRNLQIINESHFAYSKNKHKWSFIDYLISNNVTGCTMMFNKKLLQYILPFPTGFYIHDHYIALVASYHHKIKLYNKPLIYYRQHGANTIGARRLSFERFVKGCQRLSASYDILLELGIFKDYNKQIELLRDYRLSIYNRKWTSRYNFFHLLKLSRGIQLIVFYFLITGIPNNSFNKWAYNIIWTREQGDE